MGGRSQRTARASSRGPSRTSKSHGTECLELANELRGNEVPGYDEEDIDSDITTTHCFEVRVEQNNQNDCEAAKPFDATPKSDGEVYVGVTC